MTIQATRFTPEVLLSAPRRSSGIPNPSGELILYSISAYSFETHSKSAQIRVLNVKDGSSHLVSEDPAAAEPTWISNDEIAFFKASDHHCTALISQNVLNKSGETHMIHHFAAGLSNPKVRILSDNKVAFCCSSLTTPNGEMFWAASGARPRSSAKLYSSLFVRHWDAWENENQNSLWYGLLTRKDGKWTLERSSLNNLLAGTRLSSPVAPFGGTGDFDISDNGIAFVSRDPDVNPSRFTKTDLYYTPLTSFTERAGAPQLIHTGSLRGFTNGPTFSKDGKSLAFTRMKSQQYESDKPRLMMIPDMSDLSHVEEFYETRDGRGGWDARPDGITWSNDGRELYVGAEKHGRVMLWKLPASPTHAESLPEPIHEEGCVVETRTLGSANSLLVSCKSRVESSCYCIVDPNTKKVTEISSITKHGRSLGLKKSQCDEIWYPGSEGYDNHALVMKPSEFDSSKRYPLAMLIHGGPQSAWTDGWSTRWNPAILAEQGYVVVCPNPIGSTGYGQDHTDAITENWGGGPYRDLVKCFEYLENKVDYVDTDRAVALGASYGGYMINWIQGNDLGRKFKALVCHDGAYSTLNQWATDELFFPEHDFGGTLWDNRAGYEKWDPAKLVGSWATPELVIHSELDYRLPIAEGLSMFNVLQARGVPSQFLMFPDENHWVLKPENSLVWHQVVLDWVNKYSGITEQNKEA